MATRPYDPIGDLSGTFAPAYLSGDPESEAAVAAWLAKNLKTRPKGDSWSDPTAAVNPRDAITEALMAQSPLQYASAANFLGEGSNTTDRDYYGPVEQPGAPQNIAPPGVPPGAPVGAPPPDEEPVVEEQPPAQPPVVAPPAQPPVVAPPVVAPPVVAPPVVAPPVVTPPAQPGSFNDRYGSPNARPGVAPDVPPAPPTTPDNPLSRDPASPYGNIGVGPVGPNRGVSPQYSDPGPVIPSASPPDRGYTPAGNPYGDDPLGAAPPGTGPHADYSTTFGLDPLGAAPPAAPSAPDAPAAPSGNPDARAAPITERGGFPIGSLFDQATIAPSAMAPVSSPTTVANPYSSNFADREYATVSPSNQMGTWGSRNTPDNPNAAGLVGRDPAAAARSAAAEWDAINSPTTMQSTGPYYDMTPGSWQGPDYGNVGPGGVGALGTGQTGVEYGVGDVSASNMGGYTDQAATDYAAANTGMSYGGPYGTGDVSTGPDNAGTDAAAAAEAAAAAAAAEAGPYGDSFW